MLAILSCKKCEWSVCMRKKCAFLKRNWAECRVFMLETRFARLPFHPAVKVYSESGREKSLMVQLTQKRSVTPQLPIYLAGWNPISFAFFNGVLMEYNRNQLGRQFFSSERRCSGKMLLFQTAPTKKKTLRKSTLFSMNGWAMCWECAI